VEDMRKPWKKSGALAMGAEFSSVPTGFPQYHGGRQVPAWKRVQVVFLSLQGNDDYGI
jgi:hypothetical protein